MKLRNYLLIFVALGFVFLSCKRKDFEGPEIKAGTIEYVSIPASDPSIGSQTAAVYLPPDYNPNRSPGYPVIYLLHGFGGDPLYWTELIRIQDIADYLISTGQIEPCIIVMPTAKNAFGGSWYTNSPVFGAWESYIVNDVVSYIDNNYNTVPDKSKRALTGLSMGGYGAVKLAGLHPDLFGSTASHSGVLVLDAFLADQNGNGIADMIELVLAENDGAINSGDLQNLGPQKVLTTFMVAMAAAFSPKVGSIFDFDTTRNEWPLVQIDSITWAGIRLPFLNSGDTISSVWQLWKQHDPVQIYIDSATNIVSQGLRVYIDCGDRDDYGLNYHVDPFEQVLQNLGLQYETEVFSGETEGIMFPPEEFPAGHTNYLYTRLKYSFVFHDKFFKGQ